MLIQQNVPQTALSDVGLPNGHLQAKWQSMKAFCYMRQNMKYIWQVPEKCRDTVESWVYDHGLYEYASSPAKAHCAECSEFRVIRCSSASFWLIRIHESRHYTSSYMINDAT